MRRGWSKWFPKRRREMVWRREAVGKEMRPKPRRRAKPLREAAPKDAVPGLWVRLSVPAAQDVGAVGTASFDSVCRHQCAVHRALGRYFRCETDARNGRRQAVPELSSFGSAGSISRPGVFPYLWPSYIEFTEFEREKAIRQNCQGLTNRLTGR